MGVKKIYYSGSGAEGKKEEDAVFGCRDPGDHRQTSTKPTTRKLIFPFSRTKAMFVSGMNGGYNGSDGIRIVTTNGLGVLQGCLTEPIMSLVTSHHSLLACAWIGAN